MNIEDLAVYLTGFAAGTNESEESQSKLREALTTNLQGVHDRAYIDGVNDVLAIANNHAMNTEPVGPKDLTVDNFLSAIEVLNGDGDV